MAIQLGTIYLMMKKTGIVIIMEKDNMSNIKMLLTTIEDTENNTYKELPI